MSEPIEPGHVMTKEKYIETFGKPFMPPEVVDMFEKIGRMDCSVEEALKAYGHKEKENSRRT